MSETGIVDSAPVSAPVSSPAPSTPAPSTPSTPVTTSTPTADPVASPTPGGRSIQDIVKGAVERAEKAATAQHDALTKQLNAEEVKTDPATPTVPEVPKLAVAEDPKPDAEAPKLDAAKPPDPLDKIGPLPAEKIVAALKDAPPEVSNFLKEKGLSIEKLTENARLAAQTSQFQERFQTIEDADDALGSATQFWKLEDAIAGAKDIKGYGNFLGMVREMSYLLDDAGNKIPDGNGGFKDDGTVNTLVDFGAAVHFNAVSDLAAQTLKQPGLTEEQRAFYTDLAGAIDFVNQFEKAGYKMPGQEPDLSTLPPAVQERLKEADRLKLERSEGEKRQSTEREKAIEDTILNQTDEKISPIISEALSRTALTPALQKTVAMTVWNRVVEALQKDEKFGRKVDRMSRGGTDYVQRRVALNNTYLTPIVAAALEEIVGEMGGPVVDANKARLDKIDAQTDASRMDPKTSSTTVQTNAAPSGADLKEKALKLAKESNPNARVGDVDYWKALTTLKRLPISA